MDFAATFDAAGCDGSLSAVRLSDGYRVDHQADQPRVMASLVKVPIALEFYARASDGGLDEARSVTLTPATSTPGPVGISRFQHPATMALADLAYLMLTVSDNAATDVLTDAVGIDAVNDRLRGVGCSDTVVVGTLRQMLDGFATDMGFDGYSELLAAQRGELGGGAQARATDPDAIDRSGALDPTAATRTTAADMTRLLAAVWRDEGAPAPACAALRSVMAEQVTRRLAPAVPEGGALAAKSGGLFRRIRNEVAVVTDGDGGQYAVAILTRSIPRDSSPHNIERAMVSAVSSALEELSRA